MDVAFVRDGAFRITDIVSKLSANFRVKVETLDAFLTRDGSDAAVHIFCSSLITNEQFRGVRQALEICDGEKMFLFPTHNAKSVARLQDLGFRDYFAAPIDADELRAVVRGAVNRRTERRWGSLDPATRTALKSSLASFDSCFARARRGEPLPMEELQLSAQSIREAAQLGGFDTWIDALANHHNYSFRHSMFVCGALTSFAHAIGIAGADIERLAVGGLLHDIGKSSVPLAILDKPGKLDDAEWQTMRKHPRSIPPTPAKSCCGRTASTPTWSPPPFTITRSSTAPATPTAWLAPKSAIARG